MRLQELKQLDEAITSKATDAETVTFKIKKAEGCTSTGRCVTVWNVVDAKDEDEYVYDTFDRKSDAVAWINRSKRR